MPKLLTLTIVTLSALAACSSEVPDTHPDQPVTKRKQAFKAMLRSFEPMGTMLKDKRYDADAFARMADEFARLRDAFEPLVAQIESDWRNHHGDKVIDSLRAELVDRRAAWLPTDDRGATPDDHAVVRLTAAG